MSSYGACIACEFRFIPFDVSAVAEHIAVTGHEVETVDEHLHLSPTFDAPSVTATEDGRHFDEARPLAEAVIEARVSSHDIATVEGAVAAARSAVPVIVAGDVALILQRFPPPRRPDRHLSLHRHA